MIDPANPDYANTPASDQRSLLHYAPAGPLAAPAVSIVTPFYNTGAIFHETALSVLRQTFQQWEWIIVNDGSTSAEALAILDGYRQVDPRVRVIDHAQNRGPSAAFNAGFAASHADFVVQLGSDDLLEPTAVETWLWFLLSYPEYGFVKGYSVIFGAKNTLHPYGFSGGPAFLEANRTNPTAMVRCSVHQAVGGYDEAIRDGLEDWEFWLHCAAAGYWGGTVPLYLDWRRLRPDPTDRWPNMHDKQRARQVVDLLHKRYGSLWENGGFPDIRPQPQMPYAVAPDTLPFSNLLRQDRPRLLLVTRCMTTGGGSAFNLDVVENLVKRGWGVTVATTEDTDNSWLPQFAAQTPDIFLLPSFLRLVDTPRFLRYLIGSRQPDAVLLSSSEIGYLLLPYLRAHFPELPILDFCHIVNEQRINGGFPRLSVQYQPWLDANGVASAQVKQWMVKQGADANKIIVQHTNVDADVWKPDAAIRAALRRELAIADDCPTLLFAGRLAPQKQPRVLARTALALRQRGLRFVLLVAGDGPDLPQLRSFIQKNRLQDSVRLLGRVPLSRVRHLMAASDIFFLPSANEGIALAIFEAMACGLAVVGADVGGQSELVTPTCGALAPHAGEDADVQQYTTILADLLIQPARCRELGAAGRARVLAHFRLEQMVDGVIAMTGQAKAARAAAPQAALSPAAGQAIAAQAVEYMRLLQAAGTRQERPSAPEAQPKHPRREHHLLQRVVGWGINPDPRVAPAVRGFKRIVPVQIKVSIKRALWQKPPDHPSL